jgi:hypothetical protein
MKALLRIGLLALAVAQAAVAQDAAAPLPAAPSAPENVPASSEASTVTVDAIAAPIVVRQEDASRVLRSPATAPSSESPPSAGPVSRTIPIDGAGAPRPVVNDSTHFVFHDATDRAAPPSRTLAERQAAVEALRQALRRGGR